MLNFLLLIIAGWPAIIVTVILAIIGLLKRDYRFLVGAAILAFPFSLVVSGFPVIQSLVFLMPLLPFSAAFALNRDHEKTAWILTIIYLLSILLLFFAAAAA